MDTIFTTDTGYVGHLAHPVPCFMVPQCHAALLEALYQHIFHLRLKVVNFDCNYQSYMA